MKYIYYLPFILLLSCGSDLNIPAERVTEVLTKYGKENPENIIIINTKYGGIVLKLYDETPLHRANFIRLIKANYFDNRKIYRIVRGLCIQGGGSSYDKMDYLIPAEFKPNLIHKQGALSMARYSQNNIHKMSSATEFFIVTKGRFYEAQDLENYPQPIKDIYLKIGGEKDFDNEYTVFGEVIKGYDIVVKISKIELIDVEKPLNMPNFSIKIMK